MVDWLRASGRAASTAAAPSEPVAAPMEGAAPGVAALVDGVSQDRSHSVLDLGPAINLNLTIYSRFARWVRFADVLGESGWTHGGGGSGPLSHIPLQPEHPYDLVFAWDALDRLFPEDRPRLVESLATLTAPGTRLHLITRADEALARPLRFTLVDTNRIRYEGTSGASLPRPRLLPAELMKLLPPFQVQHAFTLRSGLREYVAVRPLT